MIKEMFSYKGKLAHLVPEKQIKAYSNLHRFLCKKQAAHEIPTHASDYLCGNELAKKIYQKKYFLKDLNGNLLESRPEDTFVRISAAIASVEPDEDKQKEWSLAFYKDLYDGVFVPGGRVIAGAGDLYRLKTLANCFASLIEGDNIESIYKSAYECARTYSFGGGIGVDISILRPKDSVVHNASDRSTGAVSFMDLFSLTTGLIGQSGRRGALMITIDVKHPDILDFIQVKKKANWISRQIMEQINWSGKFDEQQLKEIETQVIENTQIRFANISIKVTDEFMQAVDEQNRFGKNKILLYKKNSKKTVRTAYLEDVTHYSIAMPCKDISQYELLQSFDSFEQAHQYLNDTFNISVSEDSLQDVNQRDVYGDFNLPLNDESYDLALRYSGDFMLYFASRPTGEIRRLLKARTVWDRFVEGNYKTAEPGLIFWSRMAKYSPSNYVGRPICVTNPCAEVPLEDGGACNLGSMNLSRLVENGFTSRARLNWKRLEETVAHIVRFLDNVVTWNEELNPLEKQRRAASETRRLGIGMMGIADMLNQLGIAYDSDEGITLMGKVAARVAEVGYRTSAELAAEKGASPVFDYKSYSKNPFFQEVLSAKTKQLIKKNGVRNVALLSIAPTGTISNIVVSFSQGEKNYIGVSSGIEPIFALFYTRRAESFGNQFFKVFHSTVQAFLDEKGLTKKAEKAKTQDDLKEILPDHFFHTAHRIDPFQRVQIQGICQQYVDHSISSTVNLPEDIEPEVISDIYLHAWKNNLKGITIYRDGSRYPILTSDETGKTEFQRMKEKEFRYGKNSESVVLRGDDIISLPNGRLSTVYHFLKNQKGELQISKS
ncbi:ribonucleoside-diphosphate reductase NrdZ [bacterium BMS3Abin05]|nr:ribonucleoside-diphosphate reductase NrdZ [bacterium BMS3Abin05]GBE26436.1 ribonucleoside-diphosphate reductase NrdZ [bacterium BMS3Bbin03]